MKNLLACLVGLICLGVFSFSNLASAAPITETWLTEQVENFSTQPEAQYAIYVRMLDQRSQDVVLNSHKMASASLIKIPIMIEAYNQKKQGKLNFNEKVIIKHSDAVEGGSVYNLPDNTVLTVGQLVELMIVQSDNTACNLLIDKLKMENINAMIKKLGCSSDTILQRKMMDFEAVKQGRQNYTNITDMANLLEKLYLGKCLDPKSDKAMLEILSRQEDNTIIPAQLPHHIRIDHKTGELDGMNYDCGIVYGQGHTYILCMMAENVKDEPQVFYDLSNMSLAIYDRIGRNR